MNKVVILALTLSLAGCGADQEEPVIEEQVPVAEEVAPALEPAPAAVDNATDTTGVDTTAAAPEEGAAEAPTQPIQ